LGLFSVVVLLAQVLHPKDLPTRRAAWYAKTEATFIDALAAVRRHLWASRNQRLLKRIVVPANSPHVQSTCSSKPPATPPEMAKVES
jgi:hypothetical protein